jgi:hypothetical protein
MMSYFSHIENYQSRVSGSKMSHYLGRSCFDNLSGRAGSLNRCLIAVSLEPRAVALEPDSRDVQRQAVLGLLE